MKYKNIAYTRRLITAKQIESAMRNCGMNRKQLAEAMGRQPSEVTKWLSGTHNFTNDLLAELSAVLQSDITGVDSHLVLHEPSFGADTLPPIDLKPTVVAGLYHKAELKGVSLKSYLESVLTKESKSVSAAELCGTMKDFPTVEKIREARTDNTFETL